MSPLLLAGLSFIVVALLFAALAVTMGNRNTAVQTRLRAIAEPAGAAVVAGGSVLADERPRSPFTSATGARAVR